MKPGLTSVILSLVLVSLLINSVGAEQPTRIGNDFAKGKTLPSGVIALNNQTYLVTDNTSVISQLQITNRLLNVNSSLTLQDCASETDCSLHIDLNPQTNLTMVNPLKSLGQLLRNNGGKGAVFTGLYLKQPVIKQNVTRTGNEIPYLVLDNLSKEYYTDFIDNYTYTTTNYTALDYVPVNNTPLRLQSGSNYHFRFDFTRQWQPKMNDDLGAFFDFDKYQVNVTWAAWWNATFSYKMPLNLSVYSGTSLTGHQVMVYVALPAHASSWEELRFVNGSEDTVLPYWIEYSNATSGYVWVKADQNITTAGYFIYMYYGNSTGVGAGSNIEQTGENNTDDFSAIGVNATKFNTVGTVTQTGNGNITTYPTGRFYGRTNVSNNYSARTLAYFWSNSSANTVRGGWGAGTGQVAGPGFESSYPSVFYRSESADDLFAPIGAPINDTGYYSHWRIYEFQRTNLTSSMVFVYNNGSNYALNLTTGYWTSAAANAYPQVFSSPAGTMPITLDWLFVHKVMNTGVNFSAIFGAEAGYGNVSLNSPINLSLTIPSVTFNYTPILGAPITSCSLWSNYSGAWNNTQTNTTTITSGSPNVINYVFGAATTVLWTIGCVGSGGDSWGDNRTLNIANFVATAYDEVNGWRIPFNLVMANSSNSYNFTSNAYVYFLLANNTATGTVTTTVSSTNYYPRTYSDLISASTTTNRTAYLLPTNASSIFVRFHVLNSYGSPVASATVTVNKTIGATSTTIFSGLTDASGIASLYMEIGGNYYVQASALGYSDSAWSNIVPSQSDYYLILGVTTTSVFDSAFVNISYAFSPAYGVFSENKTLNFYVFSRTNGTNTTFTCMSVMLNQTTKLFYQNSTDWNGTSYFYSLNTTGKNSGSNITVTGCFQISGYGVINLTRTYQLRYFSEPGPYNTSGSLMNALQTFQASSDFSTYSIIALLLTAIITAYVTRMTRNKTASVIICLSTMSIFWFFGWMAWQIFLLSAIIGVAIVYIQEGWGA